LKHQSIKHIDIVEIDACVIEASKQFLPNIASSFSNNKVHTIIEDGIQFVKQCNPSTYDLIIVDSTDPVGPAEGLFTKAFYTAVYGCLQSDGIMVTQSESPRFNQQIFKEIQQCYKEIFGENHVHPYLAYIPTYPSGMWSFSFCAKDDTHPLHHFQKTKAESFANTHPLHYYTPSVHESAFVLPSFVDTLLHQDEITKKKMKKRSTAKK